jgi:hypothetical protein
MSLALKDTRGSYFFKRCCSIRRFLTTWRKYQLSPASTNKMMILEARSQYLLISTKLDEGWRPSIHNIIYNLQFTGRGDNVRRNENAKNGDVDASNQSSGAPFQFKDSRSVFSDDGDSVDDNLKKQLYFKNPKEQDEEEDRHSKDYVSYEVYQHV